MSTFEQRLSTLKTRIHQAEAATHRPINSVQLIAVSKTKPASDIACAYQAGLRHFGENYVQEALSKQALLGAFNITWHFIGPIQSNKTKVIAQTFDWVHSVDRLNIAERLSTQRPRHLPPLNICLQVNISEESSKSGIMLEQLATLADAAQALPNIQLRGVMAIPAPTNDVHLQRLAFKKLYETVKQLPQTTLTTLTTFSMGMSDDLEAAIAEGSTMLRIGSALFGERNTT